MRRALVLGLAAALSACSLVFSDYDDRFDVGDASVLPLFTDDAGIQIEGIAVNAAGIFYCFSTGSGNAPTIRRVGLDGGGASDWRTGDAAVMGLVSDGNDRVAWAESSGTVWTANVAAPSAATPIASYGTNDGVPLAADGTDLAWIGAGNPARCPNGTCTLANAASWSGGATRTFSVASNVPNIFPHGLTVDPAGVTVGYGASPSKQYWLARFATDGGLVCSVSVAAQDLLLASTTSGETYAIDSTNDLLVHPSDGTGCPSGTGTPIAQQTSAVAADGFGVYWSDSHGAVSAEPFGADASITLGNVGGGAKAIALDPSAVYVGEGPSIFRFSKPVGD